MTPEFVRRIRHAGIPRTEHVRRKKQGNILDQVGCHGRLFKWTLVSQNLKKKIKVHDISPTECVISRELSVWHLTSSTRHQEILRTQRVREKEQVSGQTCFNKLVSILPTSSNTVNISNFMRNLYITSSTSRLNITNSMSSLNTTNFMSHLNITNSVSHQNATNCVCNLYITNSKSHLSIKNSIT